MKEEKGLPVEVVSDVTLADCQKEVAMKYGIGTSLVTGHSARYFNEAAIIYATRKTAHYAPILQEKDAKIEKLMGLLKGEVLKEYQDNGGTQFLGMVCYDHEKQTERFMNPEEARESKWNEYKLKNGLSE